MSSFCLDRICSLENHPSCAYWEFTGKPLVKRTNSDNEPCVCLPHTLFSSCRHTAESQVGVFLFTDLLLVCYTGCYLACLMIMIQFMRLVCMSVNLCFCIDTPDTHLSCCRAETERGLNRKHIIEGNKSIFLASASSFPSPCHSKPCCSTSSNPTLHLYLFSLPLDCSHS